jgi:hypothetical protein
MPDLQTISGPIIEPLHLRLMRDMAAEHRVPLHCHTRQCRRSRTCCGPAAPAERPITTGERLPHCLIHAEPALRRDLLTLADTLSACLVPSQEPRPWPEDEQAATLLRARLGLIHRILSRPGPHRDHERAALAAWRSNDPDPEESALYRRVWRHRNPQKHPPVRAATPA